MSHELNQSQSTVSESSQEEHRIEESKELNKPHFFNIIKLEMPPAAKPPDSNDLIEIQDAKRTEFDEYLKNIMQKEMRKEGFSEDEITEVEGAVDFAREADKAVGKTIRQSGDLWTTHYRWNAIAQLKYRNVYNLDGTRSTAILIAAILHDTYEDTNITLKNIEERYGKEVATLVDLVTKVSIEDKKLIDPKRKNMTREEAEVATVDKNIEAFKKDPRAIFIKIADVAHNGLTTQYLDDKKSRSKGRIALDFYEPVARAVGMSELADIIGDSYLGVLTKNAQLIQEIMDEHDISPALNAFDFSIAYWRSDGRFEYLELPEARFSVELAKRYRIYQKYGKNISSGNFNPDIFNPTLLVITKTSTDAISWQKYFSNLYHLGNGNQISSKDLPKSYYFQIPFKDVSKPDSKIITAPVIVCSEAYLVGAIDLYRHSDDPQMEELRKVVARKKLDQIITDSIQERDSIRIGKMAGANTFAETIRESIKFTDKGGKKEYSVPPGATLGDACRLIGPSLFLASSGVDVYRRIGSNWVEIKKETDNGWQNFNLDDPVIEGTRLIFDNQGLRIGLPERYDLVTQKASIGLIKDTIKSKLIELTDKPVAADILFKGEPYPQLESDLRQKQNGPDTENEEIFIDGAYRGVNLIYYLYRLNTGEELQVRINAVFDSDDKLKKIFGTRNNLLANLGLGIDIPLTEKFSQELLINEVSENSLLYTARYIVKKLEQRQNNALRILVEVEEHKGLLGKIGDALARKGVNIESSITAPDNYGGGDKSTIEIIVADGTQKDIEKAIKEIKKLKDFSSAKFTIKSPGKKS